MAILVVGSVRLTALKRRTAVDHCLGGAATHFALAASYFTPVRVIAVVGEDFTAEHEAVLTRRGIDTQGIERSQRAQLSLDRLLLRKSERGQDAGYRSECLRDL